MSRDNSITTPYNLASLIRGLYGRVAEQLDLDPSYVSRVARGERRSQEIEIALEREMKRILRLAKMNHNGVTRDGAGHDGLGKKHTAKKKNKKALQ
jgi:hypothetical protein